jgi:hypothetical protein
MAPKVTRENSLIGERFAKAGAIQRQAPLCQGETRLIRCLTTLAISALRIAHRHVFNSFAGGHL